MSFFWIQHQIGLLIFLLVILFITLSNILILRKLGSYPMPDHFPRVSVLIPARNEEENIGHCVRSLLNQDYPDLEVLVLDDNSTDGTWKVLSEIASEDERLHAIKGRKLPDGWFGKHWACHQLAQAARGQAFLGASRVLGESGGRLPPAGKGLSESRAAECRRGGNAGEDSPSASAPAELFLFTDADTRHHPLALRDAVAALIARRADLLTAFPHEEVISWGERLTVPLFPWFIIAFLPLFLAYRLRSPSLSATVGQFMLFRRQAYEQIGGYEAIRQEVVDDVALGRRIKAEDLKWRMINGGTRIRCRMYHSFREGYRGFTKNLFAGFGYKILKFALVWLWLGIAFLEPIIVLAIGLTGLVSLSGLSIILAAAAAVTSLLIWGASHWCFGFPLYLTLLYPISMVVALAIAVGSMFSALTGRTDWRGRVFARPEVKWW